MTKWWERLIFVEKATEPILDGDSAQHACCSISWFRLSFPHNRSTMIPLRSYEGTPSRGVKVGSLRVPISPSLNSRVVHAATLPILLGDKGSTIKARNASLQRQQATFLVALIPLCRLEKPTLTKRVVWRKQREKD